MLLIACSVVTTISADPSASTQKKPENVIATFNAIIQKFGNSSGQTYSVNRNPNTGIIESSIKIVPFRCSTNAMQNDNVLNAVAINFPKDEPLSYQFQHIQPGSKQYFLLNVYTNNEADNTSLHVRTHDDQEMWMMCCKNPENPQLRDAYAISWVLSSDKKIANGVIYMVTSLRPDVYEKNFESSKKMFKIVGRVGDEIKDSLYNIYIADSREALYNLKDHEYVACIPVVNKRFEWQTELTKPCVGRLRCIFPDGSLCSAWIDLDFVPGETYNITVHNGYYDEDKDYERRVGRQSGKSLIEPDAVKVVDEVPAEYTKANLFDSVEDNFQKWAKSLTEQQNMQFKIKGERIQLVSEALEERYNMIKKIVKSSNSGFQLDIQFKEILKLNKDLDARWQDFFKFFKERNMPKMAYPKIYKEIIEFYTGQLREITNYYKQHGAMSKAARKVNSYVLKQNEKYMDALQKSFD
jgi:hypothetical protein